MKNRIDLTRFELQSDICDGGLSAGAAAAIMGGISAAGTVGSAAINAGARWGSSTYMRVAKEMARYNSSLNEEMYNKYQSPSAMMAQYKEAGLNPYLIYGNAQAGGPTAGQVETDPSKYEGSHSRAEIAAALANSISNYQEVVGKQIANTNATKYGELTDAQTRTENAKALYYEGENEYNAIVKDYRIQDLATRVANNQLDLDIKRQTGLTKALQEIEIGKQKILDSKMSRKEKRAQIKHLDDLGREIQSMIDYRSTQIEEMKQAIEFAKSYNPLRIQALKASNANSALGYAIRDYQFGREKALDSGEANPNSPYYYAIANRNRKMRNEMLKGEILENQVSENSDTWHTINRIGKAIKGVFR